MITLAFAQMIYYVAVGMRAYGGEEGLNLATRSAVGFGLDLKNDVTFYYVVLAILAAALFALRRAMGARFGRVVVAIRENETRMEAIGFPTYRYKLVCFVLGGAVAGLAGALLANQQLLRQPEPALLDAVRLADDHGHPRRRRLPLRRRSSARSCCWCSRS